MGLTPGMTTVLVSAGVGLIGGVVAERMLSPNSIGKAEAGGSWGKLHDDFLTKHPVPNGTHVLVTSQPAWQSAALIGGGGAVLGGIGGGVMYAASKMQPQNYPLFVGGMAAAALGASAAVGVGASWALRAAFDT